MSNTLKEYHRLRQAGYSPTFSFRYAADCGCDDHCPKSCECDCHDMKKESSDKCSSCGESNCGCTDCNCKACGSRKEASIKTAEWGYPNKNPNHYDPNRIPPEFGEDPAMRGPASRRPNTPDMRGEYTGDPEDIEPLDFSEIREETEEEEAWRQKLEELKKRHMHSSVRIANEVDGEPYQEPQDNTASVQALAMGKHIINNLWHNMDVLTFHNVEQARNHLYQLAQRDSGTYKLFLMDLLKLTEQAGEQAQGQEKFNFEHLNMELTNTLASMHEGESPFPGASTEDGPDFGSSHQASYRYAMEDHDSTKHEENLMVAPFGVPDMMPGFGGMMHEHAGPMEIRIEGELGPDTDIEELLKQVTDEIGGLFPSHENNKKESSMNALEQYHNLRTAGYSPEESDYIVRFASNTILTSDIERMQKTAAPNAPYANLNTPQTNQAMMNFLRTVPGAGFVDGPMAPNQRGPFAQAYEQAGGSNQYYDREGVGGRNNPNTHRQEYSLNGQYNNPNVSFENVAELKPENSVQQNLKLMQDRNMGPFYNPNVGLVGPAGPVGGNQGGGGWQNNPINISNWGKDVAGLNSNGWQNNPVNISNWGKDFSSVGNAEQNLAKGALGLVGDGAGGGISGLGNGISGLGHGISGLGHDISSWW